MPNLMRITDS